MSSELPVDLGLSFEAKNPITLFRMPPLKPRKVFKNAPTKEKLGYQPVTAFADSVLYSPLIVYRPISDESKVSSACNQYCFSQRAQLANRR